MNPLQIIDKVTAHLLQQNARCADDHGKCKYRCDGMKCAVGCLIPDDKYEEAFEGIGVGMLLHDSSKHAHRALPILEAIDVELGSPEHDVLYELQYIHDKCEVIEWPTYLAMLRKRYAQ